MEYMDQIRNMQLYSSRKIRNLQRMVLLEKIHGEG